MKKQDKSLIIFMSVVVFITLVFIVGHFTKITNQNPDIPFLTVITMAMNELMSFNLNIFPLSIAFFKNLLISMLLLVVVVFYLIVEDEKNRRTMPGKEYGSAKWNTDLKKYNKIYTDPKDSPNNDGPANIILTQNVFLSLKAFITRRNLNVLVVGGSGAGKSRFLVKPNMLQANSSFVITDPAGELQETMGDYLVRQGYEIRSFNLVDMSHSNCYNPFDYIRNEEGVMMLINCLIKNTTPPGKGGGDPFWEKSETALLQAIFFYLLEERPPEQRNFTSVMKLLRAAEINEDDASSKSPLDRMFEDLQKRNPNSMACKNYATFKMGAGKTLKSILISCAVRLQAFDLPQIANLVRTDVNPNNNINLTTLGDKKTALFVVIPAADDTYNFIASMMYYQLFESLYFHAETHMPYYYSILDESGQCLKVCENEEKAKEMISLYHTANLKQDSDGTYQLVNGNIVLEENKYKETLISLHERYKKATYKLFGRKSLAVHVRFLLDEFANIGQIPDFDKKLATMRKYEISCTIILQNLAQLKEMYKDKWEGLIGNCDSFLFLGGQETSTLKYVSELLGKMTEIVRNNSRNMGAKGGGSSLSYNRAARNLMEPDEISKMDNSKCILSIRGLDPFFDDKYDLEKHPNFKYTGDASPEFLYDYKKHFNNAVTMYDATKQQILKNEAEAFEKNQLEAGKPIVTPIEDLNIEEIAKKANVDTIDELQGKMTEVQNTPNFVESEDVEDTTEEWSFNTI